MDFIELVEAERAAVAGGTAQACGSSCACHDDVTCVRVQHPHDSEADMGPDRPRGDVVPHAGYTPTGELVQWIHTAEHGPILTSAEVAAEAVRVRREHTRTWLASLDLDELRAALAGTP